MGQQAGQDLGLLGQATGIQSGLAGLQPQLAAGAMGILGQLGTQQQAIGQAGLDTAGRDIRRDIDSAMMGLRGAELGAGRESRIGQRAMRRAGQGIGGEVGGAQAGAMAVSYTHLTLPTNREV